MDGGQPLFRSPEGHRLSLTEAVGRGLLRAVRAKRGHTREEAARAMGVSSETLGFWEEAERTPGGLSLEVIEQYLMGI
jgi:DNA-binding XRE family transcriptional regulator